jgi:hypothetical protein
MAQTALKHRAGYPTNSRAEPNEQRKAGDVPLVCGPSFDGVLTFLALY